MEEAHPYIVKVIQINRKYIVTTHVSNRLRGELRINFEQLYRDIMDDILDCDEKGESCPTRYEGFVYESSYMMRPESKRKIPEYLPFVRRREYNLNNPQVVIQERQKNIRDVRKLEYYEGMRAFRYPKNIITIGQIVVGSTARMDLWVNSKNISDYSLETMLKHEPVMDKPDMNDLNTRSSQNDLTNGGNEAKEKHANKHKPDVYYKPEDIKSRHATDDDIVEIIDDGKAIEEIHVPRVVPTNFKFFNYILPENRSDKGEDRRRYKYQTKDPVIMKRPKQKQIVSEMELKNDDELLRMLHDYNDDISKQELLQAYPELSTIPDEILGKCVSMINKDDGVFIELLKSDGDVKRARLNRKQGNFYIPKNSMLRKIIDTNIRNAIERNLDDMDAKLVESELDILKKTNLIVEEEKPPDEPMTLMEEFLRERWKLFERMSLEELAPIIVAEIAPPYNLYVTGGWEEIRSIPIGHFMSQL